MRRVSPSPAIDISFPSFPRVILPVKTIVTIRVLSCNISQVDDLYFVPFLFYISSFAIETDRERERDRSYRLSIRVVYE